MKKRQDIGKIRFLKTDKENIYLSKKGLSDVVTTLIIILLVLVALGVVWVVVRNVVQQGSEQVDLGKFTLDLDIKSVQLQAGNVTVVVVRRNPGEGNFTGMNFIFSDGKNSEIIRVNTTLNQLEEKSFTLTLTKINISNLQSVSVAPIYMTNSGKENTGDIADSFDIKKGTGTGEVVGELTKFEKNGYAGFETVEYTLSMSEESLPSFSKVIIDPLDVHLGDTQTFTAYVSSPYGITEVTTITELDNDTLNLDLELQEDGSYSASWQVYDTHETTYWTTFIARDSVGNENNITLTWTDPTDCGTFFTQGQDSTINQPCTLIPNEVDGLDAGKITISAQVTLDSGSRLIFNQGKSIVMGSGGSIISTSTGSFGNGYLFYSDADSDGYQKNKTTLFFGSSQTQAGYVRAYNSSGQADDCYDVNNNVFPGQSSYFTSQYAIIDDGTSWDYDCSLATEYEFPTTGGGACRECISDGIGGCMISVTGKASAWSGGGGSTCGSSGTYYSNRGICPPEPPCTVTTCAFSSQTQACH